MPSNHSHVKDQISRHCLFKVEQMTGQNIKKISTKKINLRFIKTDKKTRNQMLSSHATNNTGQ